MNHCRAVPLAVHAKLAREMVPPTRHLDQLPMLAASPWQMSYGERAVLEGVVSQLQPKLALEIGTAEGGSLRRIAVHSDEVHSFDIVAPADELASLANAVFHTGDSHILLPHVLHDLTEAGRPVDFILIDGDHTARGVRLDLEHVLASPAVRQTVILLHDTMNPDVRKGIESVDLTRHPKATFVELDLVPGYLVRREPYRLQLWGGMGLMVIDEDHQSTHTGPRRDNRFYELFSIIRPITHVMADIETRGIRLDEIYGPAFEMQFRDELLARYQALAQRERVIQSMESSLSWRITAPLRTIKRYTKQAWGTRSRGGT